MVGARCFGNWDSPLKDPLSVPNPLARATCLKEADEKLKRREPKRTDDYLSDKNRIHHVILLKQNLISAQRIMGDSFLSLIAVSFL